MGKLIVTKAGPIATIQDFGRFGYRKYGIPQSGAMDKRWMIVTNRIVGNPDDYPVVEFAISGMTLRAEQDILMSLVGASMSVNRKEVTNSSVELSKGDEVVISRPIYNYAYLAVSGLLRAQMDFGSYSTYVRAGFGGMEGRTLRKGDILISERASNKISDIETPLRRNEEITKIRIMKGPEWDVLKELPSSKVFRINSASDRMGIRLTGEKLEANYREIISSAVVPGTIQLPSDRNPIILMNDCQTTGGYPRIGKVLDEDLGKLAQIGVNEKVSFILT